MQVFSLLLCVFKHLQNKYFFILVLIIVALGLTSCSRNNPFEKYDVCINTDYPGAGSRVTVYTFVSCSDPKQRLSPTVEMEYGELKFEDLTGDGIPEAIVQSSGFLCKIGDDCTNLNQVILRLKPSHDGQGKPSFEIIEVKEKN